MPIVQYNGKPPEQGLLIAYAHPVLRRQCNLIVIDLPKPRQPTCPIARLPTCILRARKHLKEVAMPDPLIPQVQDILNRLDTVRNEVVQLQAEAGQEEKALAELRAQRASLVAEIRELQTQSRYEARVVKQWQNELATIKSKLADVA
jgi:septal ring factor EnvC (AmiA/AmiB activator)